MSSTRRLRKVSYDAADHLAQEDEDSGYIPASPGTEAMYMYDRSGSAAAEPLPIGLPIARSRRGSQANRRGRNKPKGSSNKSAAPQITRQLSLNGNRASSAPVPPSQRVGAPAPPTAFELLSHVVSQTEELGGRSPTQAPPINRTTSAPSSPAKHAAAATASPGPAAVAAASTAQAGGGSKGTKAAAASESKAAAAAAPSGVAAAAAEFKLSASDKEALDDGGKPAVNLVVIGHVDAGKSTLMGHVLYKLGSVSNKQMHKLERESHQMGKGSFLFAFVLDAAEEERSRGVTMDVGSGFFETEHRRVTLLDAPGHRDFIPNMITGTAQADVAILVVSMAAGEFEAGFQSGGQTKEHATLARSLGVRQLVVAVNKMDTQGWDQERYNYIVGEVRRFVTKEAHFPPAAVSFLPLSGFNGENLLPGTELPEEAAWYQGPSLLEVIDGCQPSKRPVRKPLRLVVSDAYKSQTLGVAVAAKLEAGVLRVGDKLLGRPGEIKGSVRGMERAGKSVAIAKAGDNLQVGLSGIDLATLSAGMILCSPKYPVPLVTQFKAQILTLPALKFPIIKGKQFTLHTQCSDVPAAVTRCLALLDKNQEVIKRKPRAIPRAASALVKITLARATCVEESKNYRMLGRFTLRDTGVTVAVGMITEIVK